jgi:hypothetical protein
MHSAGVLVFSLLFVLVISKTLTLTDKGASYITKCVSVAAIMPQEMEMGA